MRDLNEIAPGLQNAGSPLEGVATAGQPDEEHLRILAEAGYKTVIDLRATGEDRGLDEEEIVREAGMEYVNLPVGHETIDDETFERFRRLMTDHDRRPALVHCSSANRVGALLSPYLVLDEGKERKDAVEIGKEVGLSSEELEQAALRYTDAAA